MLLNRVVVGFLQNRLANEDGAWHEAGPCQDARLDDQVLAVPTTSKNGWHKACFTRWRESLHIRREAEDSNGR